MGYIKGKKNTVSTQEERHIVQEPHENRWILGEMNCGDGAIAEKLLREDG